MSDLKAGHYTGGERLASEGGPYTATLHVVGVVELGEGVGGGFFEAG
jgi:hypothetical protein